MSNTNTPWGFKPLFMTEARKTCLILPITNNYGTALYVYDPVIAVTAGTIERGGTTGTWCGIILGLYKKLGPTSTYRPEHLEPVQYMGATPGATYDYAALVAVDPNIFLTAQEDGVTSSLQITDNFGNCDVTFGAGGNTTTGISGALIDSNTIDATATRPIKLILPWTNYYDPIANAYNAVSTTGTAGNYCKWICKINYHQFGQGSLALGLA